MEHWYRLKKKDEHPTELVSEALKCVNGWVYIIDEAFKNDENVPPQAIKGCWKVNEKGIIVGDFIPNPNYLNVKK